MNKRIIMLLSAAVIALCAMAQNTAQTQEQKKKRMPWCAEP